MKKTRWLVVIYWFLLAIYVIYRCFFTAAHPAYDILAACWLGGVMSTLCFTTIRTHYQLKRWQEIAAKQTQE